MIRMMIVTVLGAISLNASASMMTQPQVIYGDDNRMDVFEVPDAQWRDLADSTAAMIPITKIRPTSRGTNEIVATAFGPEYGLCQDEPYYNQPNPAMCSAFLVGEDLIATAGHCIQETTCPANAFVFNYKMVDATTPPGELQNDDVYKCKRVVVRELTRQQDYALVQLDRPVRGHRILTLANANPLVNDPMIVIGHPAGLPTKVSGGAGVRKIDQGFFVANLDTYGGNSGSAVFNGNTGEVAGVLVRGERDFRYDGAGQCTRSNRCVDTECRGEDVTLISYIKNAINAEVASRVR